MQKGQEEGRGHGRDKPVRVRSLSVFRCSYEHGNLGRQNRSTEDFWESDLSIPLDCPLNNLRVKMHSTRITRQYDSWIRA